MSSELAVEHESNGVLRLTMNRPDVHNAFDDQQILRLTAALEAASGDPDVRVVIIGSAGNSFSAGGDVSYMRRMGNNTREQNLADARQVAGLMRTLNFLPQPTIARVQGAAMGGGVGLVSCCDYAVGTPRVKMALSEVRLGLAPATIAPYVVNVVGEKAARQLFQSGLPINAEEALRLGLLYQLVEESQLDRAVDDLAATLAGNAPGAMRAAKRLARAVASQTIDEAMIEATVSLLADLRESPEGREGLGAFLEKRRPDWSG